MNSMILLLAEDLCYMYNKDGCKPLRQFYNGADGFKQRFSFNKFWIWCTKFYCCFAFRSAVNLIIQMSTFSQIFASLHVVQQQQQTSDGNGTNARWTAVDDNTRIRLTCTDTSDKSTMYRRNFSNRAESTLSAFVKSTQVERLRTT